MAVIDEALEECGICELPSVVKTADEEVAVVGMSEEDTAESNVELVAPLSPLGRDATEFLLEWEWVVFELFFDAASCASVSSTS